MNDQATEGKVRTSREPAGAARGLALLAALGCAWLSGVAWMPAAWAEQNPMDRVRQATEQLFEAVEREREAIRSDPARARAIVREVLTPHLDLKRTSQWVLGRHWRQATPEQRARFIEEFRTLLVRTYAAAVAEFSGSAMEYLPLRGDPEKDDDVIVRTRVSQDEDEPLDIVYRLHRSNGEWKVYDVAVSGVSLVTTYRSSFAEEVRKGGIEGLIERLATKNREVGST